MYLLEESGSCTHHMTLASTTQQVWSSDRSCSPCLRDSTPSSAARLGPLTGKRERRQIVVILNQSLYTGGMGREEGERERGGRDGGRVCTV